MNIATSTPIAGPTAAPNAIVKTGNLTRDLFNYARNGAYTRAHVVAAMENVGYLRKSAQSLITQLLSAKMFEEKDGRLYSLQAEYTPIANNKTRAAAPARSYNRKTLLPAKHKKAAGLAALKETKPEPMQEVKQEAKQEAKAVRLVRLQSATEVLANMSVTEAYKLYVELHAMFGGK